MKTALFIAILAFVVPVGLTWIIWCALEVLEHHNENKDDCDP